MTWKPGPLVNRRYALLRIKDQDPIEQITAEEVMGVRKFRSVAEMPGPPARLPLDPENLRILFGLIGFTHELAQLRHEPGVRRFHSWDEALRWRMERERSEAVRNDEEPR